MKKWILVLLALAVILVLIYVVIPAEYTSNNSVSVNATEDESKRILLNKHSWNAVIAIDSTEQKVLTGDSLFVVNNTAYKFVKGAYGSVVFEVENGDTKSPAFFQILPKNDSSVWLNFRFSSPMGSNPLQRIRNYFDARSIDTDNKHLLNMTATYLNRNEAENRKKVVHTRVVDTAFLTLQFITDHYPSTTEIYSRLDSIEQYASEIGARITGYPMLNVSTVDDKQFFNMVALPINQKVNTSGRFLFKKMIRGNILVYEFTGGQHSTREAFRMMDQYLLDHKLESPAIPYVSLVTDRRAEPDTSKWVSKIYYPVF